HLLCARPVPREVVSRHQSVAEGNACQTPDVELGVQRLFVTLISALLLSAGPVLAASIVVQHRPNEPSLVSVQGTFVLGDDESFHTKTARLDQATVSFESNGGNLLAGIRIGMLIRQKGFSTVVEAGSHCASACALAWL